jgi:hypothetical protein
MKELENEQQQMIEEGIDFLKSARDGADAWRSYVVLSRGENVEPITFAELTKIIAYHLREGYFMWKDLPASWSLYMPLVRECVRVRHSPSPNQKCCNDVKKFQWRHLPDECKTDVDVVLTAISNKYIQQWDDIPIALQSIESVAFAAWKSFLRWHEKYYTNLLQCSPTLNRDFFISCIEQEKVDDWDDLPQEYRTDIEFARGVKFFPSKSIAYSILDEFQELCQERETWVKVLRSTALHNYVGNLLELFAPVTILSDRPLMLQACQFDTVLRSVDETLGHDRSFLLGVLQLYPQQLIYLDNESQHMFPDLVLSTLTPFSGLNLPRHAIRKLIESLDPSFWNYRTNYIIWFTSGLPHPHVLQSERTINVDAYYDNEEIALLIAAHCRVDFRKDSFATTTSDRLRSDKSFLTKVLELDPMLILCAADELQTDFDLALMSVGNSKQAYEYYAERHTDFLEEFLDTVNQKLTLYDSYVHLVLGGIMQPQSYLCKLGQDNETTISFKKSIAAYLDVPFGQKLRWLRQSASLRERW